MSEEKLTDFLRIGKDWSKLKTSVPGMFVLKLPVYRRSPTRLAVELNPVDDKGNTKKRRGFVLRSEKELEEFKQLFDNDKLSKLLGMIESVNPKTEVEAKTRKDDIIEI